MDQEPHLRAGDLDRQRVAERLRSAVDEGRLSLDEYDERLRDTYGAKTYGDLAALTADLPPVSSKGASLATARQIAEAERGAPARQAPTGIPNRWSPWRPWLMASLITTVIWALTGADMDSFWPVWVIVPWGLVLALGTIGGGHRHYRRGC